ncbi:MAG: hypothetical protein M4579_006903 [Chaenotheca gracillima]|nr:MAG: hypothetical protein M4579_006903 [Chaenotheca gracillima]
MESLKSVLIANRGEIALRIIKTTKRVSGFLALLEGSLGIRSIAIYTESDRASPHVTEADEAILLSGGDAQGYTNGSNIVEIAKQHKADAIIPGYGFLSENADFAREVKAAGLIFVGPKPEDIESFGLKHKARELAVKAGVPVVPGSDGLIESEDEAVKVATQLGFPVCTSPILWMPEHVKLISQVMLKATAGGGGMGLATCATVEDVKKSFETVRSRGKTLFKNPGIFIERFYPSSHHIEAQLFGNGLGQAIHFGERECSIQRRHQKVIEECPSPFVTKHPDLREELGNAAVRLAESLGYGSAGTVEYLVDDETGKFFFLEMNTRLQVEHGITELCYGIDLVELMLKQADAEMSGKGGLKGDYLKSLQPTGPEGAAIEARVYAENPARDYAPSPGTLQLVQWGDSVGSRIDTWIRTGTIVTSHYDPLLAKAMNHASSREGAIKGLHKLLSESTICGPPTNLTFLAAILEDASFGAGKTITKFLESFSYNPAAIDVLGGGAYTQIQDYPGRPLLGKGFPHSGPMDPLAFRIANLLVGNAAAKEGLEITLRGPDLLFLGPAVISLCGAPVEAKLDGKSFPMWTRVQVKAGQKMNIGKTIANGCRAYLAVYGGFPNVAEWFGSKATSPMVGVGGYQGRALAPGDLLGLVKEIPDHLSKAVSLPKKMIPEYTSEWDLHAMVGPYDEGYLLPEDIEMIYNTEWKVSHNAARGGIRLIGPKPKWARSDGGEGGSHPSNVIEYGYPLGTLNWTGDDPCIFPVDCPDFGGFVSSTTIIKADWWRLGQMKAGDTLRYRRVSLDDALSIRREVDTYIAQISAYLDRQQSLETLEPLQYTKRSPSSSASKSGKAVVHQIKAQGAQPAVSYRQGADDYLLIEYGEGVFDLNHRCRVTALQKALRESNGSISFSTGLINMVGCGNSLMLYYDGSKIRQDKLVSYLGSLEGRFSDLREAKVPSRVFKLPITFESKKQTAAMQRYQETQRPYAPYIPDSIDFVAKCNGFSAKELKEIYLNCNFMAVAVGFFCALPLCLPVDPRYRMSCPKTNPSRVFTPEGQVGWGGSCMALYNVESPGGYQLTGLTIPGVDFLGFKEGYSLDHPWLFEDFDQLTYYEVSEEEYERQMAIFHSGQYRYEIETVTFDMKEHNKMLDEVKGEVAAMKSRQAEAQKKMLLLEEESMKKWSEEKAKAEVPKDTVEALLSVPEISTIDAPLNANVWKVTVSEGDALEANQTVAILEAMKLEIAVKAEEEFAGAKVEKLLVKPGDIVNAGDHVLLARVSKK